MGKVKKYVGLLLTVLMVGSLFAGCGNKKVTNNAVKDTKQEEVKTDNTKLEVKDPVKITLWHGWSGVEQDTLKEVIAKYKEYQPNVTIETLQVPFDQLQEKLKLAIQAGNGPDVFIGPHDWTGTFASTQSLEAITDYTDDFKDQYIESTFKAGEYMGQQYGIPESIKTPVLIYNKDMVKEAPTTTDDLLKVAKENAKDGKYGLVMEIGNFYIQHGFFTGYGNEVFTEVSAEKVSTAFDSQGSIDFLKFLNKIKNEEKVIPQEIDYNTMMSLFQEGKSAFMINGPWCFGDLDKAKVNYGIANYPTVSATGKTSKPFMGAEMLFVPKGSKNLEVSVDFAKYMTNKDMATLLNQKAGHVPSNKNVDLGSDWKAAAVQKQAQDAEAMPNIPEMAGVWEFSGDMITKVLNKKSTPEAAAKEAQDKITKKIKEIRGQ